MVMTMAEVVEQLNIPTKDMDRQGLGWMHFPIGCIGLRDGLRLYLEKGVVAGGALMAVLEGDLWGAEARLDANNWKHLGELMRWLNTNPPAICYGSKEKVATWISHRGAEGYESAE